MNDAAHYTTLIKSLIIYKIGQLGALDKLNPNLSWKNISKFRGFSFKIIYITS